jgi:hypothetical protein
MRFRAAGRQAPSPNVRRNRYRPKPRRENLKSSRPTRPDYQSSRRLPEEVHKTNTERDNLKSSQPTRATYWSDRRSSLDLGEVSKLEESKHKPGSGLQESKSSQTRKTSPIQTRKTSPIQTRKTSPIQTRKTSPIQMRKTSPIQLAIRTTSQLGKLSPWQPARRITSQIKRSPIFQTRTTSPCQPIVRTTSHLRTTSPYRSVIRITSHSRKTSPVQTRKTSPVQTRKTSPVQTRKTSPVQTRKTSPVQTRKTSLVQTRKTSPCKPVPRTTSHSRTTFQLGKSSPWQTARRITSQLGKSSSIRTRITSPCRPVTRITSPCRPVTRTTSPCRPVTRTTSPCRPVTRTTSPCRPVIRRSSSQTRKTSPLTLQTRKTSPLTLQTRKTSPLTLQTRKTSPLTLQTRKSPVLQSIRSLSKPEEVSSLRESRCEPKVGVEELKSSQSTRLVVHSARRSSHSMKISNISLRESRYKTNPKRDNLKSSRSETSSLQSIREPPSLEERAGREERARRCVPNRGVEEPKSSRPQRPTYQSTRISLGRYPNSEEKVKKEEKVNHSVQTSSVPVKPILSLRPITVMSPTNPSFRYCQDSYPETKDSSLNKEEIKIPPPLPRSPFYIGLRISPSVLVKTTKSSKWGYNRTYKPIAGRHMVKFKQAPPDISDIRDHEPVRQTIPPNMPEVIRLGKRFHNYTLEIFLYKAYEVHGFRYYYGFVKEEYINGSTSQVPIYCFVHDIIWLATITDHVRGSGCLECANNIPYNKERFIKKSKQVHGEDKYGYDRVREEDIKCNTSQVELYCYGCEDYIIVTIGHHVRGHNCLVCALGKWTYKKAKKALALRPEINTDSLKEEHVFDNRTPVPVGCNTCGWPWWANLYSLVNEKTGCPRCAGRAPYNNLDFLKSKLSFRTDLDLSLVTEESIRGNKSHIKVRCKVNPEHVWETMIQCLVIYNMRCPECTGRKRYDYEYLLRRLAPRVDLDTTLIKPEQVQTGESCVPLKCKVNPEHVWETTIRNIIRGSTCPFCSSTKGVRAIANYVNNFSPTFEKTFEGLKDLKSLRVDIYLESYPGIKFPICIEYDGDYPGSHFSFDDEITKNKHISTVKRDKIKDSFCVSNGMHLLRIPYTCFPQRRGQEAINAVLERELEILSHCDVPTLILADPKPYEERDNMLRFLKEE